MTQLQSESVKQLHEATAKAELKRLKKIVRALRKKLIGCDFYENKIKWNLYVQITGHYNENYLHVYFNQTKIGVSEIEIASITDKPQEIIQLIRAIDKDFPITYSEVTYKQITI